MSMLVSDRSLTTTVKMKVIRLSINANSFGLRDVWLLGTNRQVWSIGASYFNIQQWGGVTEGQMINVPYHEDDPQWHLIGVGPLDGRKPDMPAHLMKEFDM